MVFEESSMSRLRRRSIWVGKMTKMIGGKIEDYYRQSPDEEITGITKSPNCYIDWGLLQAMDS